MARATLEWTTAELAERSKVGVITISHSESGQSQSKPSTLAALQREFKDAEIDLIPDNRGGAGAQTRKAGDED